jgi:hypothetical protein
VIPVETLPVEQLAPVEEHPQPLVGLQMKQLVAQVRPATNPGLSLLVLSPAHPAA